MTLEFPAIEAHEELDRLADEAASLVHILKLQRHHLGLVDHDQFKEQVKAFYSKIDSKAAVLGASRTLRILRLQVPAVRGIDRNKADVSAERFLAWRAANDQLSQKTRNEYLGHGPATLKLRRASFAARPCGAIADSVFPGRLAVPSEAR